MLCCLVLVSEGEIEAYKRCVFKEERVECFQVNLPCASSSSSSLSQGECRRFYVPGSSTCCWFVKFFPFLRRWKSRAGNTSLYPRPFSFTLTDESILQAWSTCFGCTDHKWKVSRLSPPFSLWNWLQVHCTIMQQSAHSMHTCLMADISWIGLQGEGWERVFF